MKHLFSCFLVITFSVYSWAQNQTENIILVTMDGYRWQELFEGAELKLVENKKQNVDCAWTKSTYWDANPQVSRKKIMPFVWDVISSQGQLFGNRNLGSEAELFNNLKFSYPGYSELFCGFVDKKVNSNEYPDNPNYNLIDYLQSQEAYKGKVAVFGTWDAFPRIINSKRNNTPSYVSCGWKDGKIQCLNAEAPNPTVKIPETKPWSEVDTMTYWLAKDYMVKNHPKFLFIGFDETDHYAHGGKYDAYLTVANQQDAYLKDLWNTIQSDPFYKDKTTLIVTCDHGRGILGMNSWKHHGHVRKAHETFFMFMGPNIPAKGENVSSGKFELRQLASTMSALLKLKYDGQGQAAPATQLLHGK